MGKFYPKIQNYLFQVTNCTWTNSNMQNLKVMFTFFLFYTGNTLFGQIWLKKNKKRQF